MASGIELIAEERKRQVDVENFDQEHDQQHEDGDLALAAVVYALPESMISFLNDDWGEENYLHFWPFDLKWLKKDYSGDVEKRKTDLIKAGALIAAEIDRMNQSNQNLS